MYTLPELPYDYAALEPVVSKEIMMLHHQKHHQAYVDKLNAALESVPEARDLSLEALLSNLSNLPEPVREAVRNQGGGHYNHSLFWTVMTPEGSEISESLKTKLAEKYGSFENFTDQFNEKATKLFGSGWVWLTPELETVAMPNQDSPLMTGGAVPILGLDVWEHAYYLDYKNKRDEYIKNWWKIVNWPEVERRLGDSKQRV